MKVRKLHRWDVTPEEARQIQEELRGRVELRDRFATEARHGGLRAAQRHREKKENRKEKIEKRPTARNA
ncbi:MAG: hypothetical protein M1451_08070, partial [Acidobacteria bacterium]|nr:hypothetical protein [Acidobacteriota bacterium]